MLYGSTLYDRVAQKMDEDESLRGFPKVLAVMKEMSREICEEKDTLAIEKLADFSVQYQKIFRYDPKNIPQKREGVGGNLYFGELTRYLDNSFLYYRGLNAWSMALGEAFQDEVACLKKEASPDPGAVRVLLADMGIFMRQRLEYTADNNHIREVVRQRDLYARPRPSA